MSKVIITVAVIGAGPTREQSPYIPITPAEIADSAVEAFNEGASIAHIHVRNPETGEPSNEVHLFEEVVERITGRCNIILNLSTGAGGGLYIGPDGTTLTDDIQSAERRVEHVLKLRPEMCSLDIGTMNFGIGIFANTQGIVDKMAELIKGAGVKPEVELFDAGHIEIARRLLSLGLVEEPPHYQLCLGTQGGLAATPKNAVHFSECLPPGGTWSVFGVAQTQFPMVAMGALLDGHIRVGFEDNLYMKRGVKAERNADLVKRAADIIKDLNKEVASVDEAREILRLKKK
ncbi:MAG: 3-keto-5-aminohexanoate cleavage protein [Deltaproteobacteria bacterium]|nr:3-keto-5-aminohexanoate cleavage protein [Deltaproteobacteria bacterium]MBW2086480.1 3-keto-5-aminohexanoate cleavage protein [Deltaproteobacteria bacterium]